MKKEHFNEFDDALPEQLIDALPTEESALRVKVGEDAPSSPFIVKLTREGVKPAEDPITALRNSLILELEDNAEEADLVEAEESEDALRIALRDQLMERDSTLSTFDEAVPVALDFDGDDDLPAPVMMPVGEAVDIFEALDDADIREGGQVWISEHRSPAVLVVTVQDVVAEDTAPASVVRPTMFRSAFASFIALALLMLLPLQGLQVFAEARDSADAVKNESTGALDRFLRGASSLSDKRFTSATEDFSRAAEDFRDAEESLNDLHAGVVLVANVIPEAQKSLATGKGLVTAGEELSETAEILALAADDIAAQNSIDLVTKIRLLSTYLEKAEPHVVNAEEALSKVDAGVVPPEYKEKVEELQAKIPALRKSFDEFLTFADVLTMVLGGEGKVRYLAAFQNNTELRPTGGFVGSFAEIDMRDGAIERLHVPDGGSYSIQGQQKALVAAPGPLQLLRARWEFQDANWFPDFRLSAKKMLWFSNKAGGPTMDGVVAVNATFVQDLLEVLGPVDMPSYGRTITAENFLLETQKIVELEYDKTENAPKAFIGDLAPILLERMTDADLPTLLAVLELVGRGLEQKDIQLYFANNDLEATVEDLGWSGGVKSAPQDYLMVTHTNLGGGKTDQIIDDQVDVVVDVAPSGAVENTVTVTRTHRGLKSELFTGVNNVDYLRLYVPEGSKLISVTGMEIPDDSLFETVDFPLDVDEDLAMVMKNVTKDEATGTDVWDEEGKTVFGNWMQTAPGETETVTFTYRLPFTLDLTDEGSLFSEKIVPYSLFLQKQPGVKKRQTTVRLHMPQAVDVLWNSAAALANLTAQADNAEDVFFAWLLRP